MLYRQFLRLPTFKGKARIDTLLKRGMAPRPVRVMGGLAMLLDPQEWTQAALLAHDCIEPLTIALMQRLLRPGDTYVDVGAHVGFHTLMARQAIGHEGRVIAVEPQPYNCDRILTNWRLNGFENIDLFVAVAGDRIDSVPLHNQAPTDKARLSLALPGVNDLPQRFHVPMVRVADIAAGPIRLVKIDAEGFEPEVLRGCALDRVENVILEVLPGADSVALDMLRERGFALRSVAGGALDNLPESNVWAHATGLMSST